MVAYDHIFIVRVHFDVLMIWLARFGGKLIVQAFGTDSLVVKKNRFGLLEQLYNECNQNAIILFNILFMSKQRVFHQHFASEKVWLNGLSQHCH